MISTWLVHNFEITHFDEEVHFEDGGCWNTDSDKFCWKCDVCGKEGMLRDETWRRRPEGVRSRFEIINMRYRITSIPHVMAPYYSIGWTETVKQFNCAAFPPSFMKLAQIV